MFTDHRDLKGPGGQSNCTALSSGMQDKSTPFLSQGPFAESTTALGGPGGASNCNSSSRSNCSHNSNNSSTGNSNYSANNSSNGKSNANSNISGSGSENEVNEALISELVSLYLPHNYDFEVLKTARRLACESARRVALQLPEGLLAWGYQLACILHRTVRSVEEVFVLGDVSYGACCVDDLKAEAVEAAFLVHYGHSCLVPTQHTQGDVSAPAAAADAAESSSLSSSRNSGVKMLYVFVDILVDPSDLSEKLKKLLPPSEKLALQGTIQFTKTLHAVKRQLDASGHFLQAPLLPQVLPLTAGEVLGCTAPKLRRASPAATAKTEVAAAATCGACSAATEGSVEALATTGCRRGALVGAPGQDVPEISTLLFLGDGRFHLEASMIQNPGIRFLRYDPFIKRLFEESYDYERMHTLRRAAIDKARYARTVGVLFSTLGRQGSVGLMEDLLSLLEMKDIFAFPILMAEFAPHKLEALFPSVDVFIQVFSWYRLETLSVQVGCPRLSIDWGAGFPKPLLSPYEAHVAFGTQPYLDVYPMDFYARDGGPWTNYNSSTGDRRGSLAVRVSLESRKAELRARLLERQKDRRQRQGQATDDPF